MSPDLFLCVTCKCSIKYSPIYPNVYTVQLYNNKNTFVQECKVSHFNFMIIYQEVSCIN